MRIFNFLKRSPVNPRLSGIGFSLWGIQASWAYTKSEFEVIRHLFIFLENCRVLFDPYQAESPPQAYAKTLDIRKELEDTLKALTVDSKVAPLVRAMQRACRKFLTAVEGQLMEGNEMKWDKLNRAPTQRMLFDLRLGGFREVFNIYVAVLSRALALEIHGELRQALPELD